MASGPRLDVCEIKATQVLQPLERLHFREPCWVALEPFVVPKEQQQFRDTKREVRAVAIPYRHCLSRDSFSHTDRIRPNKGFRKRFSEQFTFLTGEQFTFYGGIYMFSRPTRLCQKN